MYIYIYIYIYTQLLASHRANLIVPSEELTADSFPKDMFFCSLRTCAG